ncbi:hypothetical protein Tco_0585629 [Tanacetum coccineum]
MHHRSEGLSKDKRAIFKHLEKRLFYKGQIMIPLTAFAQILRVLCEGACMYMVDWSLTALPNSLDSNQTYHAPLDYPVIVRDTIFTQRDSPSCYTRKGELIVRDPFQIELHAMKPTFKKWEVILSENVISLTGYKDHLKAYLVYMI